MIKLQVREFFETRKRSFCVYPGSDPSHYDSLVQDSNPQILGPSVVFDVRSQLHQNGYVLVSTDLSDFAPPTPTSLSERYDGPYYGEAMLALIGQMVGTLQSLSHQHGGRTFHDVMPIQSYKNQQTSGSSDVTLEMHTELSFLDNPPEYLMLFCVRQDQEQIAETHLYDSRFALDTLTLDQYSLLTKHSYRFEADANVTETVKGKEEPVPVFDRATSRLLRYDIDTCEPVGQKHIEAYSALTQALLDMRVSIRLKPGQVILIDNKRIVHSRSKFKANYDGKDRWLKRALVRGN